MTWKPSTWKPSINIANITKTVKMGEPTGVRMETNALQKGQDLLNAGKDMDSVCREISPEYANWGIDLTVAVPKDYGSGA